MIVSFSLSLLFTLTLTILSHLINWLLKRVNYYQWNLLKREKREKKINALRVLTSLSMMLNSRKIAEYEWQSTHVKSKSLVMQTLAKAIFCTH